MSALLAAIGCGFLGIAIGAALQRWGDADRATHGHTYYPPEEMSETEFMARWERLA